MPRVAILWLLFCSICGAAYAADNQPRRFVIFFTEWSAAVDESAQDVISQAAAVAKSQPRKTVKVIGYADPTGSRQANILLSELRAQRVADQLASDGVAASRVERIGRGSVRFAHDSQESRRVEVSIGGR
jgi:outer membrane protein OmpA-like peptidoglycan-associated protein